MIGLVSVSKNKVELPCT